MMKIVRKSNTPATSYNDLQGNTPTVVDTPIGQRHYAQNASNKVRTKHADFTNMTHRELRDWVSGELHSGRLTLKQSTPFMWLTIKSVLGRHYGPRDSRNSERVNFIQKAQEGLETKQSGDNGFAAEMFKMAIDIMIERQGQTIGVDTSA